MSPTSASPAVIALRDVLDELRHRPPAEYRSIAGPERWSESVGRLAEATIADGWRFLAQPPVRFVPGLDWDAVCASNRSWAFQLHAWDLLEPVLLSYEHLHEDRLLDFAVSVAHDWARRYPDVVDGDTFAWYDMAVGLRAARLAFVVDRACRADRYDLPTLATLVASIDTHRAAFADDARFAAHSNHGLYFAAGQLVLADTFPGLPGMDAAAAQARARLLRMVRTQFTAEGVHAEHSPDYHRMVHGTLLRLVTSGVLHDEQLEELIVTTDRALSWFVLPNGRIAMLGDSPGRIIDDGMAERALSEEATFIYSSGSRGTPPSSTVRIFPASGYAVVRGSWRAPGDWANGSYLLLNTAFHSRVHKHADDQSIIWYDRGAEILVDPGRFGYLGKSAVGSPEWLAGFWYTDPRRMYVESTRAHNCLVIDGRDYARRGVTPYGSAIRRWASSGEVTAVESSVLHWGIVLHRRRVVVLPGEWLLVIDDVDDESGDKHDLVQRFHFAPELEPVMVDRGLRIEVGESVLHIVEFSGREPLEPERGTLEPQLLGWIAREDGALEPCATSGFAAVATAHGRFATLFRFARTRPHASSIEESGDATTVRWHDDAGHRLVIGGASGDDTLSIEYTTGV